MPQKGPRAGFFVLMLISAGFLAGVVNLFLVRFEAGDSYNKYSSLRSDPLGTKVLYDSLDRLEEMTAVRNYQPLAKIGQYGKSTLFLAGVRVSVLDSLPEQEARAFESFVIHGGRLILLFYPFNPKKSPAKRETAAEQEDPQEEKNRQEKTIEKGIERKTDDQAADDCSACPRRAGTAEKWKVVISRDEASTQRSAQGKTAVPAAGYGFTLPVAWHSSLWFSETGPEWTAMYVRDGKPVIIERTYGKGSIVLAGDSYFASNEAALKERNPELLAWLVGGNSLVVFDETHLGVQEVPGVASLIRKYRLNALFAGFLFLAVLFVWKNSSSLVPAADNQDGEDGIRSDKDYLSGFTGLLGRTIPHGEILAVCLSEWKKVNQQGARGGSGEALAALIAVVEEEKHRPARERDPVGGYRTIQKLLSERKKTS